MSNENRISLNIPDDVVANIKLHFSEAAVLLAPYLINLTPEEKNRFRNWETKVIRL